MSWRQQALDSLALVGVLVALGFAVLFARRWVLGRSSGAFECSLRMAIPSKFGAAAAARGWTLGLGRYSETELEWFRIFSFSPRPKHTFQRSMTVHKRRTPAGAEAFSLYGGHVVAAVKLASGKPIELAMSESDLTGFLAWVESAPPRADRTFE